MTREELKEKIIEISNSEFPLIDFFNDIDWLDDRHFNTEKAYEDIEKIYDVFMFYINKCKKIEKELKQTKLNFRNSQTHSKNCYKKLKEKFERGKEVYHRNYELIQENGKLKQENQELKEAIKVLKEKGLIFTSGESGREVCICLCDYGYGVSLTQEEYELLKSVLEEE